jgi:hypothetical protein
MKSFKELQREIICRGMDHNACDEGINMVEACKNKVDLLNAITRHWIWCYEDEEIIDDEFILGNFTKEEIENSKIYLMQDKLEYAEHIKTLTLPTDGWDTIILGNNAVNIARTNLKDKKFAVHGGDEHFTHKNALRAAKNHNSRLPSKKEWKLFSDYLSVLDYTNNGRWFRCAAPANKFVDVFIPNTGVSNASSGEIFHTDRGLLWNGAVPCNDGYDLIFCNTSAVMLYTYIIGYGFSVRCVRDL